MLFSNIHVFQPDGTILSNAYVEVKNGHITYVGKKEPKYPPDLLYPGKGKVLIPGFVNAHCHVSMTLLRGTGKDLPLSRWLQEAIFPLEAKLTGKAVYAGAMLGIAEMLASGVTSFQDMYYFGAYVASAVLQTGIKANISVSVTNKEEKKRLKDLTIFSEMKQLISQFHNEGGGRLYVDTSIHGEYTSTPRIVRDVAEFTKINGLHSQIHLSETEEEVNGCLARHNMSPPAYFESLGFFENPTTAAHCVSVSQEDREILAENKVTVAHCPISNGKLGSGMMDVQAMQKSGVAVAIGTDGAASNDNLDMLEEVKVAALMQKALHKDPAVMPAKEVLKMATKTGAAAQGRMDTGEIREGFCADLAVIDLNGISSKPCGDICSTLLYGVKQHQVVLTMVNGKILYQNGDFLTMDIQKVMWEAVRMAKKLRGIKK